MSSWLSQTDESIAVTGSLRKNRRRHAILDSDEDEEEEASKKKHRTRSHKSNRHEPSGAFSLPSPLPSSSEESEYEENGENSNGDDDVGIVSVGKTSVVDPPTKNVAWSCDAPPRRLRRRNFVFIHEDELFENAFMDSPRRDHAKRGVVDLCANNSSESEVEVVGIGLRTPPKSPRFNSASRTFFQQHASPGILASWTEPAFDSPVRATRPKAAEEADEIVDCWSSDDSDHFGNRRSRPSPRRISDQFSRAAGVGRQAPRKDDPPLRKNKAAKPGHKASERNDITPSSSNNNNNNDTLSNWKMDAVHRCRRLRDAVASNTATVGGVVLKDSSFEQVKNNLWYREGMHEPGHQQTQPERNDLSGGSGVGAGKYQVFGDESQQEPPKTKKRSTTRTSRKQPASSENSRKRKTTTKKKRYWGKYKSGRGRSSGYRSRSSKGNRNNYNGNSGNTDSVWGAGYQHRTSYATGSRRQDPDLAHAGGAKITF